MKRLPIIPTILVGLAIATMIGLGIWQLQRAEWKAGLIERYAGAAALPPAAWPAIPPADGSLLYRRAEGLCLEVVEWTARGGRSIDGRSGWRHIASCRTGGGEGPGMQVDMGWSESKDAPKGWRGGPVAGVIDSDRDHLILLVASTPAPGLKASAVPSPRDLPDNHRAYAVQWFLFAGVAALIYVLALRRRGGGTADR